MNKSQMLPRSLEHDYAVFQLIGLSISFLRRGMQDFLNKSNRGITSVKSVTYSYTQELRTTLLTL